MNSKYSIKTKDFLNPDGTIKIMRWAEKLDTQDRSQLLSVSLAPKKKKMKHSVATGEGLVSNGQLGADMIHIAAGKGFVPHTHPGDHLLIVVGGEGTITYNGKIYPTKAGEIYMIEGEIPHAVGAITDHVILAVGSPHKPVDSEERMRPVEYQEITTEIKNLHCLICNIEATFPEKLHERGCTHCPCYECLGVNEE